MREMGANSLRTFTVPPRWLLDRAAEHGLRVLVGIPWTEHVCFLDRKDLVAKIHGTVRAAADNLGEHPALLGLLIGNEIPPDIVRWYGPERVKAFLGRSSTWSSARAGRPGQLRELPAHRVPRPRLPRLHLLQRLPAPRAATSAATSSRLQNLAERQAAGAHRVRHRLDARRRASEQAEILSWQVRAAFESGVGRHAASSRGPTTGSPAASRSRTGPSAWSTANATGSRRTTPCRRSTPARCRRRSSSHRASRWSICAYNAERTMDACLESLRDAALSRLRGRSSSTTARRIVRWRSRETLSGDRADHLAREQGPERGAQRRRGARHRRDRRLHRLRLRRRSRTGSTYLAYKFVACGLRRRWRTEPPAAGAERGYRRASRLSPGGPMHVLVDDEVAEHIPGCNMAFTKAALLEVARLRSGLRGRRRRRRLLLAPAEPAAIRSASARRPWCGTSGATP